MIRLQHVAKFAPGALFLTSVCATAFAGEPLLAYRGVPVGESVLAVQKLVKKEFPVVQQPSRVEPILIKASDAVGASYDRCPSKPYGRVQANCLKVDFHFDRPISDPELAWIEVDQSFAVPISSETLIAKLEETYGAARYRYEGREITTYWDASGEEDIGLVWGGNQLPKAPYRPDSSDLDNRDIGGKFVTAVIFVAKGNATGYKVSIVDGDRLNAASQLRKERVSREREKQKTESVDALKF